MKFIGMVAFLSLFTTGALEAQGVVPPGESYVEDSAAMAPSTGARWRTPESGSRVLRVFIGPPPEARPGFWSTTRRALHTWEAESSLPLRFETTREATEADIVFRWIDRFATTQAGSTRRRLDEEGFVEHATVVLARTHSSGVEMSDEFVLLVALHEVGHAVGLPHSGHPGDAMHPGNRNLDLSPRDIRSARVLYGLPTR